MQIAEAFAALKTGKSKLSLQDQGFADSLLMQAEQKGLSQRQLYWVEKLAERTLKPAPEKVAVGAFDGVIALFDKAAAKLKYPKVRLQLPSGEPIALSRAKDGSVNVTDGKPYGQNQWYGKVSPSGAWTVSNAGKQMQDVLQPVLMQLAAQPAQTAAAYGKMTGNCCFCVSPLTDPRSVEVGYGPVCAKNWGLPWGKEAHPSLFCD